MDGTLKNEATSGTDETIYGIVALIWRTHLLGPLFFREALSRSYGAGYALAKQSKALV